MSRSPQPLLHHPYNASGLSEHEYISKLIDAVAKRPVLYNVELVDYKNKNKKGEGFKEVQNEMRDAGANETQGLYFFSLKNDWSQYSFF